MVGFSVYSDIYANPAFVLNNDTALSSGYLHEDQVQAYIHSIYQQGNVDIEIMKLQNNTYVCSIPVLQEQDLAPVIVNWEEQELQRAKTNGLELLKPMSNKCLYLVKDWWTYAFCYGKDVRQFHVEQPTVSGNQKKASPRSEHVSMNFVLGKFSAAGVLDRNNQVSAAVAVYEGSNVEIKPVGETNSLIYQLGKGTVCEITGEDRTIEVQFFCNPTLAKNQEQILWIKEVKICHYLIAIQTWRLCQDVVFVPPKKNGPYAIDCKRVLKDGEIETLPMGTEQHETDNFKVNQPSSNHEFSLSGEAKSGFTDNLDETLSLVLAQVSQMIKDGEFKDASNRPIGAQDKFSTIMSLVDLDGKSIMNVKIDYVNGELAVSLVSEQEMAKHTQVNKEQSTDVLIEGVHEKNQATKFTTRQAESVEEKGSKDTTKTPSSAANLARDEL